jgi:hypothetical protein
MGIGGGEEGRFCVRGVEAGRAGTYIEAFPMKVDVCAGIVGLERFVEVGWPKEEKEIGWGAICD